MRTRSRSILALVAGLSMIMGLSLQGAASAVASPGDVSAKADCFVSDPDRFNGKKWRGITNSGMQTPIGWLPDGHADFAEHGEILTVVDKHSNGRRVVVDFDICYDGKWREYKNYDSGKDEGANDVNRYNLAFKDGRSLRMRVCQADGSGGLRDCGAITYMVA